MYIFVFGSYSAKLRQISLYSLPPDRYIRLMKGFDVGLLWVFIVQLNLTRQEECFTYPLDICHSGIQATDNAWKTGSPLKTLEGDWTNILYHQSIRFLHCQRSQVVTANLEDFSLEICPIQLPRQVKCYFFQQLRGFSLMSDAELTSGPLRLLSLLSILKLFSQSIN